LCTDFRTISWRVENYICERPYISTHKQMPNIIISMGTNFVFV
jgi:hypothetical protein